MRMQVALEKYSKDGAWFLDFWHTKNNIKINTKMCLDDATREEIEGFFNACHTIMATFPNKEQT